MDVFISWNTADKDVKNALVTKLQDAGLSCWDSDRYCTSDYAAECTAAIRQCSVFIVIISDASMEKGFVQNEVTTARNLEKDGKLNILVYKITDKPYTDAFDFLLNHISFVTGNLVQRKSTVTGESGIGTIVKRAQTLLQRRKDGQPEKPFDVHIPRIDGLKLTKTGYFVDGSRDAILEAMEEGLQRSNVLILTELFGFGKRSTVKKFVERYKNRYPNAVMVRNECGSLREFFLVGLNFTNINEKTFDDLQGDALLRAKLKFLEKLDDHTLLVIPDVHFDSQPDTDLCEMLAGLKCHILLLSQSSADAYVDWFPVIQVGRMSDEHLYELFFHHYVRAFDEEKEALREPLAHFFANIGGHTKTVELTAAALNRDLNVPPEAVPGYLSMQGAEGLQLKDRIIHHLDTIFRVDNLSREEVTALLVAACIAVPYVSEKNYRTVLQSCGVEDWHIVAELDQRRWLDLDVQNRSVSIEPLVAQIIFSKFPMDWFIVTQCLNYHTTNYRKLFSISTSEASVIHILTKLEYFLTVTDLPVCAQLVAQLCRKVIESNTYDPQKMTDAIGRFEEAYPAAPVQLFFTQEEEEEEEEEETVEEAPAFDRSTFEAEAQGFLRQLLPLAKYISRDVSGLLLDFSSEGNRVMMNSGFDMSGYSSVEDLLGMPKEEMLALLEMFRQEVREQNDLDEDSFETFIIMECLAILDSFYNRDQAAILFGFRSLLEQVTNTPELLQNETCAEVLFGVFQAIGRVYLFSHAYASAILLCERLLQYPAPPMKRMMLLQIYVQALRGSKLYTPALYDAYKQLLETYDKSAKDVFDLRMDMLREKKEKLLMYAEDLALGEQPEAALTQFAVAWKLSDSLLIDETAACANCIADILIRTGDFSQAAEFIGTYFPPNCVERFMEAGNEQTRKIMEDFAAYQNIACAGKNDFDDNADPRKYISYYHAFSRKNNSLLEQKYFSIADDTMDYDFSALTDCELADHAQQLRKRARKEKMLKLAPEAFALASEAGFRVLGYRHHYVQHVGAAAMADGKIAEILNGEGKTYTIVLTAFLHWLYGNQVFVVDQSSYLTARNHNWMRGVYDLLGVPNLCVEPKGSVSMLPMGVIYCDLQTLIFGFLHYERDVKLTRAALQLDSVIIDEIDTALVDEADREFLSVYSQQDRNLLRQCRMAWDIAQDVAYNEEYYSFTNGNVILQPAIYPLLARKMHVDYEDIRNLKENRKLENAVATAILCCAHYEKDRDYFIENGIPVQENKEKGVFEKLNPMYAYFLCRENDLDTRYAEQALSEQEITLNTIYIRDFFKKFRNVCGTTATAVSFRNEFREIYDLDYISVPPHCPCIRQDNLPPVYVTKRTKDRAILELIKEKLPTGQPILLITQSVEESEKYSRLLRRSGIEHSLLNARNSHEMSDMLMWAGVPGSLLVTNAIAGRGADIKLGGNPDLKTRMELVEMGEDVSQLDSFVYCLPTPEQKETPLYQKYYSILEKNKALCAAHRQAVVKAGGLCVIGTSFFPEPRTEQQIRGRSGRQGDVGESWVFRSLEDESLIELIPPASMAWIRSLVDGNEELEALDLPILHKTIVSLQKQLHHARFARIRKRNSNSQYIDKARKDFIGLRFDLSEGLVIPEELLKDWASDKFVLQQLQHLQRGEDCSIPALTKLFEKTPRLQTARGSRAAAVLCDAVLEEVRRRVPVKVHLLSDAIADILGHIILSCWKEYIDIVKDTVGNVALKEQSLERFFEAEKKRLLRKPVEQLLSIQIKESRN